MQKDVENRKVFIPSRYPRRGDDKNLVTKFLGAVSICLQSYKFDNNILCPLKSLFACFCFTALQLEIFHKHCEKCLGRGTKYWCSDAGDTTGQLCFDLLVCVLWKCDGSLRKTHRWLAECYRNKLQLLVSCRSANISGWITHKACLQNT